MQRVSPDISVTADTAHRAAHAPPLLSMSRPGKLSVRLFTTRQKESPKREPLKSSHMEHLPVEINLKILSYLNYEELRDAKSNNSHFQQLIELKDKHCLFDPGQLIQASYLRIRESVRENIEFRPLFTS